jgi:predicted ATPase
MVGQNKSNPKFIAFTGPGCSGKTTLIKRLDFSKFLKGEIYHINSHTRELKHKGFPINSEGSDDTQIMITLKHFENIKNDLGTNCIFDRCVLDGFVYTKWLWRKDQVSNYVKVFAEGVYMNNIEKYNIVFYCVPDFKYTKDKDRDSNKQDIEIIKAIYDEEIKILENTLYTKDTKIIRLTGNVEERKIVVENQLKNI